MHFIKYALKVTGFSDYILQQKLVMYLMLTVLAFETERLKPLKFDSFVTNLTLHGTVVKSTVSGMTSLVKVMEGNKKKEKS